LLLFRPINGDFLKNAEKHLTKIANANKLNLVIRFLTQ